MNKLDRLYKKALRAIGSKEEHERFCQSLKAAAVYFDLCSHCYNHGIDLPDLSSNEGDKLINQLFRAHDYECTQEEFMVWYGASDTLAADMDEDFQEMFYFVMDYGGGDGDAAEDGHSHGGPADADQGGKYDR